MIISCAGNRDIDRLKEQLAECGARVYQSFRLIPGVAVGMTPDSLKLFFSRYPDATVVPDRRRCVPPMPFRADDWAQADLAPTAELSPANVELSPLALELMKAHQAHDLGIDGTGVRVCFIDSGVDLNHPELAGTFAMGPDNKPLVVDFTETDLKDTLGHGTAVAGSIAAQGRQTYTIIDEKSGKPIAYTRIKGIAPGVRLMSAKVFDSRVASGYDSTIIAAMEWAAENGAQIINMSLGGSALPNDGTDSLAAAVTALRERGILVVTASGNEGSGRGTLSSPGCSPGALTVGASTSLRSLAEMGFLTQGDRWASDQLAAFSGQGPTADGRVKPDILAPGAYDWGLAPVEGSDEGRNYQLFGGTSQATPFMVGAAALVAQGFFHARGRYPSPDEVIRLLCSTADDLGLPPFTQGTGRVNCLRAVQAAMQQAPAVTFSQVGPVTALPGEDAITAVELTNTGKEPVEFCLASRRLVPAAPDDLFTGEITAAQATQEIHFNIPSGTDAMQAVLTWPSDDHTPRSPRLLLAIYDPEGRFVNYQTPNASGDVELGKCVDTWIGHPAVGTWTARVLLRLGNPQTVQSYNLSIRRFRRSSWTWVAAPRDRLTLAPGEQKSVLLAIHVPEDAAANTHCGQLLINDVPMPLSILVPVALQNGEAGFGGTFEHGYQGSWNNGDWFYHDLPIPQGTEALVTSLQWPDVDNALELYLVNPSGMAVMGRSNSKDVMDDGETRQMGGQFLLSHPEPGSWRLVLHSFAFCGRGFPEPYVGKVETAGELVSPRAIQMRVGKDRSAPMALSVQNPGHLPITVVATALSTEPRLIWRNLSAQIKTGVSPDGRVQGTGYAELGTMNVPVGAKQLGVIIIWDQPGIDIALSIYDPVSQNDRATATGDQGDLSLVEANPVPGEWAAIAGITEQISEERTVNLKGAIFVVAPETLDGVTTAPVTIQPGDRADVAITVQLPEGVTTLAGRILLTTTKDDQLGDVPFLVELVPQPVEG